MPSVFIVLKMELLLLFFLLDDFLTVVETAVLADPVRYLEFMAVRALHECRSRCLIVRKALVRSALRLFSLGYSHKITSLFIPLLIPYGRLARLLALKL